jgi:hypothetical protein
MLEHIFDQTLVERRFELSDPVLFCLWQFPKQRIEVDRVFQFRDRSNLPQDFVQAGKDGLLAMQEADDIAALFRQVARFIADLLAPGATRWRMRSKVHGKYF